MIFLPYLAMAVYEVKEYLKRREARLVEEAAAAAAKLAAEEAAAKGIGMFGGMKKGFML